MPGNARAVRIEWGDCVPAGTVFPRWTARSRRANSFRSRVAPFGGTVANIVVQTNLLETPNPAQTADMALAMKPTSK
jgi:hypothetical protein